METFLQNYFDKIEIFWDFCNYLIRERKDFKGIEFVYIEQLL